MKPAELFPDLPRPAVQRSATLSPDGRYRYDLTRRWAEGPTFTWVMLNPSTADASLDDPTIRRVIGFSRAAGAGRAVVVNCFAWRATRPRDLFAARDPIGPDNDRWLRFWSGSPATKVIVAWGAFTLRRWAHKDRPAQVLELLRTERATRGDHLWCVDRTRAGAPRHPLYVPAAAGLRPYP